MKFQCKAGIKMSSSIQKESRLNENMHLWWFTGIYVQFNPLQHGVAYLYPLKTSILKGVLMFSGGNELILENILRLLGKSKDLKTFNLEFEVFSHVNVAVSSSRSLKVGLSSSKKQILICFNGSPSKMMKYAFYFILKALFILKDI